MGREREGTQQARSELTCSTAKISPNDEVQSQCHRMDTHMCMHMSMSKNMCMCTWGAGGA